MELRMDPTISVGHLISAIGFLLAVGTSIWNMRGALHSHHDKINTNIVAINTTVDRLETAAKIEAKQTTERLDKMESKMNDIATATVAIARQDERMNAFEHRLDRLEENIK
jgi:predicted  nucleic acid-binding Zn-ribbon protein